MADDLLIRSLTSKKQLSARQRRHRSHLDVRCQIGRTLIANEGWENIVIIETNAEQQCGTQTAQSHDNST
ncbi:unnamed protein product, partial [Trichogramma brassicae]